MKFVGKYTRTLLDHSKLKTLEKVHQKYRRHKTGCPKSTIALLDKSGFNNPFGPLKSCYAKGQESKKQEKTIIYLN